MRDANNADTPLKADKLISTTNQNSIHIFGCADANLINEQDGKFVCKVLFKLHVNTVNWRFKKQNTISLSFAERNRVALTDAAKTKIKIKKKTNGKIYSFLSKSKFYISIPFAL